MRTGTILDLNIEEREIVENRLDLNEEVGPVVWDAQWEQMIGTCLEALKKGKNYQLIMLRPPSRKLADSISDLFHKMAEKKLGRKTYCLFTNCDATGVREIQELLKKGKERVEKIDKVFTVQQEIILALNLVSIDEINRRLDELHQVIKQMMEIIKEDFNIEAKNVHKMTHHRLGIPDDEQFFILLCCPCPDTNANQDSDITSG